MAHLSGAPSRVSADHAESQAGSAAARASNGDDAHAVCEVNLELSGTLSRSRDQSTNEGGGGEERVVAGIAVDSELKAKKVKLWSVGAPYMRCFHMAWFSFFVCFVSSFAAAPLLPVIRDDLNLRKEDIGRAGLASVCGSIMSRMLMGFACDIVGPRYAFACTLMLTAPAVFCMATVSTATGFILCRFFIGFSLAASVICQFWMSSMFSAPIVGLATGLTSGCGNLGGGGAQLIMPLLFELLLLAAPRFTAWRLSFFIPGSLHIVMGLSILAFTQDTPRGNYRQLRKQGDRLKDSFLQVIVYGVKNYRTWVIALTYGYCFGVELTINNVIAEYFYDKFELNLQLAGVVASVFGMANFVTRPFGGALSDFVARRFGMRGRLWTLWIMQSLGGLFCVLLGRSTSLGPAIATIFVFAIFAEGAGGATTSIIPFVSRRSLGVVNGITGAGGNVGAVITQLIFFTSPAYSLDEGLVLMGIMSVCCTVLVGTIYFPPWGGMFCPASKNVESTEEAYYRKEWSSEDERMGMHEASLKFAQNSIGERGKRRSTGNMTDVIVPSQTRVASSATPPQNSPSHY